MQLLPIKPFQEKLHAGYCGPAVLKMILGFYDIEKSETELAQTAGTTPDLGTDDEALKQVLENHGLAVEVKTNSSFEDIKAWLDQETPVIVNWFTRGRSDYTDSDVPDGHYSVIVGLDETFIYLQDPEIGGLRKLRRKDFLKVWFDFRGERINSWNDMVIRQAIAVFRQ